MGMKYRRDHNSNGFIINIQHYNGVMDINVIRIQKYHSQLKACITNKSLVENMIISTHEMSPDPQQTSPSPCLTSCYLWCSSILTSMYKILRESTSFWRLLFVESIYLCFHNLECIRKFQHGFFT